MLAHDQRRPGARPGLAARDHPGRATPCATCSRGWAPRCRSTTRGLTVAGTATRSSASTPTCTTSASCAPAIAALCALADDTVPAARHRPHPRPRDRPARRAGHRAARPGRGRDRARRRAVLRAGPAARRHLPHLRRPPDGARGRRRRLRRRGRARRGRRHHLEDVPRLRRGLGGLCCDDERALRRARPGELRAPAPPHPSRAPRTGPATTTPSPPWWSPSTAAATPAASARRGPTRDRDEVPRAGPQGRSSSATGCGWSATPPVPTGRWPGS